MNNVWINTLHIDRVVALCYSGYPERTQPLMIELGRVGLSDVAEIAYTYSSPVDGLLMKAIPHVRKLDKQPGQFNAVMGHYGIAKTSIALGCNNVLVLEDDCRFLKDLSKIDDAITQAPDTWDGLTFDAFVWKGKNTSPWSRCGFWRSAAAVCYSKKMLRRLVSCVESAMSESGRISPLRNYDAYFDTGFIGSDMVMYRAYPNLAIQCNIPGPVMSNVHEKYKYLGIDVSEYSGFNP